MFEFNIISGSTIKALLDENPARSIESVKSSYLQHHNGKTVNPDSYFLRFPNNSANRIIALPAAIQGDSAVSGIKWIASFPDNIKKDIPRASAVLLLNDPETGYPFACMEAALISASRTAASAVLGAYWLNGQKRNRKSIAYVGAGVISRNICDMFIVDNWSFDEIYIHDQDSNSIDSFVKHAKEITTSRVIAEENLEKVLQADIVIFATNSSTPYVLPPTGFSANQIILNISLRDIAAELILDAQNIVDDIDHCLKANTSPHLAELKYGHQDFISGTLAEIMLGEVKLRKDKPIIYSPFGMGILDLALGKELHDEAIKRSMGHSINNFYGETQRW